MADHGDDTPRVPEELPLPPYPLSSETMAESYRATAGRPSDPQWHTHPAPPEAQEKPPRAQRDPKSEQAWSRAIVACFVVSALGSLLFAFAYVLYPFNAVDLGQNQNLILGSALGATMLGLGVGMILMGKKYAPAVDSVQERPPHHSEPEDELAAEEQMTGGMRELGLHKRTVVRRTLLTALGLLPLPFLVSLRDTGPRPADRLRQSAWRKGDRLVDIDTLEPVKLGDIDIGGIVVVMPEGKEDTSLPVNAESVVNLLHLGPGINQPLPGRGDWAVDDHVAYSRICTHAGCPVALWESRDGYLLCPCHQSTFDVPHACRVVFGPAARALPQLPIYVDDEGYFRAKGGFGVAPGPSFWSRDKTQTQVDA